MADQEGLIKTSKTVCKSCLYHQVWATSDVCCMYYVATLERRGCPEGMCDKYKHAMQKEHNRYWLQFNNNNDLDEHPGEHNRITLRPVSKKVMTEYYEKERKKRNDICRVHEKKSKDK